MRDEKTEAENIEFIIKNWNLISPEKKRLLQILGITPEKHNAAQQYETKPDTYKAQDYTN